jgi:hypothetical protein
MTIYGMSQSSGVERRLRVEMGSDGVVLIIFRFAPEGSDDRDQPECISCFGTSPFDISLGV